jgi:hypothetical protein
MILCRTMGIQQKTVITIKDMIIAIVGNGVLWDIKNLNAIS